MDNGCSFFFFFILSTTVFVVTPLFATAVGRIALEVSESMMMKEKINNWS